MSDWKSFCLGDVATFKTGKLNSNAAEKNGKYPFFTCAPEPLKINSYSFDQQAILLAGNNAEGNFHIKYYEGKFDAYQRTYVFSARPSFHLKFLYYSINLCLENFKRISVGTATKFLTAKILNGFTIPCPPLDTQKKIAAVLSALDDKIELNNAINKNLEEQAQAIYKNMFVDNFNPAWKSGTLSDIAEITSGKRPLNKFEKASEFAFIPIFGASSIMGYTSNVLSSKKILITGRVGTHGIIQRYDKPCWVSDNAFIITSNYYEYIFQILHSINYNNLNRGSTQPLLTQKDLKKFVITIPDEKTLIKFENVVGDLMSMHDENIFENKKLGEIRDALLAHLMSGEIDVSKVEI